jgi:hypothetical protein
MRPQHLAGRDLLAFGHKEASLGHVAILGLPPLCMAEDDAVATFEVGHVGRVGPALERVGHPVAQARDRAGRSGEDVDAAGLVGQSRDGDVGAVVAVISERSAGGVLRAGAGVMVEQVLQVATLAHGATAGRRGPGRRRGLRRGLGEKDAAHGGLQGRTILKDGGSGGGRKSRPRGAPLSGINGRVLLGSVLSLGHQAFGILVKERRSRKCGVSRGPISRSRCG